MKGSDLRCPVCGRPACDVAPDYELSPWEPNPMSPIIQMDIMWHCTAEGDGHVNFHRSIRPAPTPRLADHYRPYLGERSPGKNEGADGADVRHWC